MKEEQFMSIGLRMIASHLEAKGYHYRVKEDRNAIEMGFNTDNKDSMDIVIIVDDDDESIGIRSFNYVKFPVSKIDAIYKACSQMSRKYRWIKFYVDESDNTVTLAVDAVIQLETAGAEALELSGRMITIGDEAYPEFMKIIWS